MWKPSFPETPRPDCRLDHLYNDVSFDLSAQVDSLIDDSATCKLVRKARRTDVDNAPLPQTHKTGLDRRDTLLVY